MLQKKKALASLLALAFTATALLAGCGSGGSAPESSVPADNRTPYERFEAVEVGMTIEEAEKAGGFEAENNAINTYIVNFDDCTLTLYVPAEGSTDIIGRSINLSAPEGTLSQEQAFAVQPGMTYDEVKELIGSPGFLWREFDSQGVKKTTYNWCGESFVDTIDVTFTDNVVSEIKLGPGFIGENVTTEAEAPAEGEAPADAETPADTPAEEAAQ